MNISSVCTTTCCGMDELSGFSNLCDGLSWMGALRKAHLDSYDNGGHLSAILIFSKASYQTGKGSPTNFSKWLRSQGETVQNSVRSLNKNSGNYIQAFMWVPSKKFRKKFADFDKEQTEKELQKEKEEQEENDRSLQRFKVSRYWP